MGVEEGEDERGVVKGLVWLPSSGETGAVVDEQGEGGTGERGGRGGGTSGLLSTLGETSSL